jgi:hypothetical protein
MSNDCGPNTAARSPTAGTDVLGALPLVTDTLRRRPARSIGTIRVVIEGHDLPGRRCGPDPEGVWYEDVHVGLARGTETDELVPGDAERARWSFEVDLRRTDAGAYDFAGPFVHGPRDERYLALRWVRRTTDGRWDVFRGAKFRLYEMPDELFDAAARPGHRLIGRVGLTDEMGWPRCATVRPPAIEWIVEPS